MKHLTVFIILCFSLQNLIAIEGDDKNNTPAFIKPDFSIGKAIPSNSDFPETGFQTNYSLSLGKIVRDSNKAWAVFLNYPTTGVSLAYTNLGNNQVFGSAYSLMPFITFKTSTREFNSVHIKVGLGTSYFTNHYHKENNTRNIAIGSTFTWTFQTSFFYNLYIHKHFDLNLGLSFIHHSNGHTQLPNLGLNSVLFSIGSKLFLEPIDQSFKEKYQKPKLKKSKQYFAKMRFGMGLHEFGGPATETGGVKRSVNIITVGVGAIYKQVVKVSVGLTYRFYHQYYNYIKDYQPDEYTDSPTLNASNLIVYIGGELLLGHIGIDGEIGINVFKPFYKEHHNLYEDDEGLSYWLKKTLATRLGLKLYLKNTAKNPKNNLFIGVHLNANMGQADFSEVSLGIVHRFNIVKKENKKSGYKVY